MKIPTPTEEFEAEPPEPTGAEDCVCGEYPIFEWDTERAMRCICPKCKRSGKLMWGTKAYAVEAWNEKIAALRRKNERRHH